MTSALTTSLRRLRRATNGRPARIAALVVAIIVILVATPQAQQPAPTYVAAAAPATAAMDAPAPTDVDLLVGRSTILNVGGPIARVSLTVPDIADAMVTAPTQLLIHGKQPGTISLFVWDRAGAIKTFEVKVRRDLTPLIAHVKQLFPGEPITVMGSGKDVVISGTVSSKYVIEKAADVAAGYVDKKENVVNLLKQQEGVASNQVMLRVRFAEVSRNALQELGGAVFSDGYNNQYGRITTQQFPAPFFDQNNPMLGKTLVFSDYLNLFLFDAKNQIGAVVKALQGRGVFESLAEPNLIALNGKEASFLAGGEFPYPVPQGNFGSFTIQFKEYGVRLSFTPTVLGGDLINLKIKPEVSSLDFNNAVVIEGFRIPALTSRRADTEVELRDGQTFAIAGLLNNSALSSMRKVPGLGDIPVLGTLFKSRAYQKDQTELVVMVTPIIVRRDSTGVSQGLPSLVEPFLGPPSKTMPLPEPYTGSPRNPVTQKPNPAPAPVPAPAPAPAAQAPAEGSVQSQPLSSRPLTAVQAPGAQAAAPAADRTTPALSQPLTKQQLKAIEQAREEERKAFQAQQKKDAEAKKTEDKRRAEEARKTEELRKQVEKLEQERQKREADEAKKTLDRQVEQERQKSLNDAAARLKEAQDAYQQELSKSATKTASR
jgi:pilus assembly protein CpaC